MVRARLILALTIAVAGSAFTSSGDGEPTTAAEMKAKVDAAIPVGTPIAAAEGRLLTLGFTVARRTDAPWDDREHVDYVLGYRADGIAVQARWRVALFGGRGVVTGTDVKSDLVGL